MEYIEGVDFLEWVRPYNLLSGEHETDLLGFEKQPKTLCGV